MWYQDSLKARPCILIVASFLRRATAVAIRISLLLRRHLEGRAWHWQAFEPASLRVLSLWLHRFRPGWDWDAFARFQDMDKTYWCCLQRERQGWLRPSIWVSRPCSWHRMRASQFPPGCNSHALG